MVADLVAFAVDALHETDVVAGDSSPIMKKVALTSKCLRTSRIFGVHSGSGPSSKVMATFLGLIAVELDRVGEGVGGHHLGGDAAVLGLDGVVVVEGGVAGAVLWFAGDAEDVAVAFGVDVVAGGDVGEGLDGVGAEGGVPDLPEGVVFGAETPEGEGLQNHGASGAHLVHDGDSVEEPDLMADVAAYVVIGEVRVEGVGVELDGGFGVGGGFPCFLGGDEVGTEDFFWWGRTGVLAAFDRGGGGGGSCTVQS